MHKMAAIPDHTLPRFGPLTDKMRLYHRMCPACHKRFKEGDFITLVPLGPGEDKFEQKKAATRKPYNAVAIEVHWTCATGKIE